LRPGDLYRGERLQKSRSFFSLPAQPSVLSYNQSFDNMPDTPEARARQNIDQLLTEADTCRKYVLPKLYAAGWSDDHINEQRTFTDGRIVVAGNLIDFARTTAGQYNVSLGRLRVAQIPVPPLQEQREIVQQIRTLEAKTAPLISLQAQTAAELDALMPSILSRAFLGEL
jgi:hypothetical protein